MPVFPDPTINVTMYASTKHAVTALCQGLRCELKNMHDQGFRVKVTVRDQRVELGVECPTQLNCRPWLPSERQPGPRSDRFAER